VATYDVAQDRFGALVALPSPGRPEIDPAGSSILLGLRLFDRSLASYRTLPAPCGGCARTFTPDGQYVYFGQRSTFPSTGGFQRIRLSDDAVVQTVFLPFWPHFMLPLPHEGKMLVVAYNWAAKVDMR
jgi:hypothetical protein